MALCLACLLPAGCAPMATVDGHSLWGKPIGPGTMAMLPPILSPAVQDTARAVTFSRTLQRRLQQAGLAVRYDDLGGQLAPHVASTQAALQMIDRPGTSATQTAPASEPDPDLRLAQRYDYWQERGFRTVVQPVIRQYGNYPRYVPATTAPGQAYWTNSVDMGWYGGWGEGPNRGWEPDWGAAWSENVEPGFWTTQYGTMPGTYTSTTPMVWGGHLSPAATIALDYQIFDVPTRQHIYYIRASSSSFRYRPAQLEPGFAKPLIKAFRGAMGGS